MSYKSDKKAEKEQADNKDAAQNSCVVCFKQTEIFSIGECDHVVCYECSARLRVLLKQKDCMICRAELSQVIFTTEIKPFIKLTAMNRSGLYDTKYRICFTSLRAQTAFYKLLENPCSVCDVPPFPTFGALKDHMRKEHELFYCDICTDNLTVFSFERKCYNRVNLGLHRRRGDPDNTSHKGHPMCEFCDRRYLDRDELFRHLRREHYYCHFCDADGLNHYYADYDALKKHFQSNHFLCEEEACAEEKFTSVFRTEIDLRAHIASTHSRSIGKLATKQARTLEVEFTLAPRNRMGESSRGSNRNNNPAEEEVNYYETSSIVQHAPRPIDAQNEQEFPSLGGSSSSAITVRPSVSIRAKTYGPGGLARTKENFPALGGSSSDVSPIHKNSNNSNGYNALFKNGSSASNSTNSGKVMIHLSNRPSTSNATAKKPEVNPKSARDFPSLGKKANLESDFVPLVPVNNSSVSAKHRSIVNQTYESAASGVTATKVGVVPRESVSVPSTSKSAANVPKLNLKDNFPALGNGTDAMASASWITAKKPVTESRKSKVAPPPLSTAATSAKVESKPNSAASKPEVKSNGKVNNKKDKVKPKVNEKKEEPKVPEKKVEPKGKVNKKTESKPLAKSDSDESECVPSQSVLNVVSSKHRNLINGYDPAIQTNTSKLQFVKRESDTPSEKSTKATVPAFSSTNNFPSLGANDTKFRENNNNNMAISFIDIMKNAKDPVSEADSSKTAPPPGFDKSRKKPTQPPPGFNSVTLNSVVKPTNNLTFTSSLGESYSILPTHHYLPPKNSTKRNKALFAHFQENEDPETVEQFKEISKMFISGSYHALPYYEHCKFALKDKFDVIFPELLVLLPDISKQQELYLVHSQQLQASGNKNKKPTKKNQNLSLEVCATCKQVLIASDLSTHLQSHSLENNFPKLGNQDALSSASAWNK